MVNQNVLAADSLSAWSRVETVVATRNAISVEVIADTAAFAAMESAWNETVDRACVSHPFLRHEWLRTWWECFGAGRRLHILVVKSAGRILAIAPLMWEAAWMWRAGSTSPTAAERPRRSISSSQSAGRVTRAIRSRSWGRLRSVLQLSSPENIPTLMALRHSPDEEHATSVWPGDDSPTCRSTGWGHNATLAQAGQNIRNRWTRHTKLGHPALEVADPRRCDMRRDLASGVGLEARGERRSDPIRPRTGSTPTPGTRPTATGFDSCHYAERPSDRDRLQRLLSEPSPVLEDRLRPGVCGLFALPKLSRSAIRDALRGACRGGFPRRHRALGSNGPVPPDTIGSSSSRRHEFRGRLVHRLKFRLKPAVQRAPT
jgi:hypothetical protein